MTKRKLIGHCAVDSGQLLVVDPCYLSEWKDGEFQPDDTDPKNVVASHYNTCCHLTMNNNQGGEILVSGVGGFGVCCSSGLGDGSYPVYAEYMNIGTRSKPDIRISKLIIDFQLKDMAEIYNKL